jgi:hypothetical protein
MVLPTVNTKVFFMALSKYFAREVGCGKERQILRILERFSKQLIQRFRELQPSGVRVPGRIQKRRNSLRDQFF